MGKNSPKEPLPSLRRESNLKLLWGEVVQLEEDVILLRAAAPPLPDLEGHAARDDVPGGQVLPITQGPSILTSAVGSQSVTDDAVGYPHYCVYFHTHR